jgi:hypothetical protein
MINLYDIVAGWNAGLRAGKTGVVKRTAHGIRVGAATIAANNAALVPNLAAFFDGAQRGWLFATRRLLNGNA